MPVRGGRCPGPYAEDGAEQNAAAISRRRVSAEMGPRHNEQYRNEQESEKCCEKCCESCSNPLEDNHRTPFQERIYQAERLNAVRVNRNLSLAVNQVDEGAEYGAAAQAAGAEIDTARIGKGKQRLGVARTHGRRVVKFMAPEARAA